MSRTGGQVTGERSMERFPRLFRHPLTVVGNPREIDLQVADRIGTFGGLGTFIYPLTQALICVIAPEVS